MPNSLHSSAIGSPASRRATNCSLSSITEHSFQGIHSPPKRSVCEKAFIQRAGELFKMPGNNVDEEEAIDDALRALHCLRDLIAPEESGVVVLHFLERLR